MRAALAAALILLAATPALAGLRVDTRVRDHSGTVRHVRISDHGVQVDGADADSDSTTVHLGRTVRIGGGGVVVDDNGSGMVRLFSDARVEKGERVDGDVVAVFGSVRVDGEVTGSAVAVFGSVELGPGAVVGGDAVAVGGPLDADRGRVGGQSVSVGILPLTLGLPALPVVLLFVALGWLLSFVFGWLFGAIFPERLTRVAETSSRRTFLSLLLGLASVPLVPIASVLLMVTVVGLPLGILLPFAHLAIGYLGQLSAAYVLGCKLLRRRIGAGGAAGPMAAGNLFLAAFFAMAAFLWGTPGAVRTVGIFFALVGGTLLCGLWAIGTGAFLLSRFGGRTSGAPNAPAAVPAPREPQIAT